MATPDTRIGADAREEVENLVTLSEMLAPKGFAKVISMLDPDKVPELLIAAIYLLGTKR